MIKLAVPEVGEEEILEIQEVINSKFLVQGKKVEELEKKIGEILNIKHVIAVSSGTAALHLSLMSLGIGPGDEVIVPNYTFPATANVVEIVGATPKFVDIKLEDFCIDEQSIEQFITSRTKAIIPVQEFGQSADMDKILEIAKKHNIEVIEDAACAFGAKYKNKHVGTIGNIGCFSLHPRKAITTGEGGIIVTDNDKLASKIRIMLNHGISYESGKIDFILPGLNYRMTDIQGAMALAQLKKMEYINTKRKEIAKLYNTLLKNDNRIFIPQESRYNNHIWQTYHILFDKSIDRDSVIKELKKREVESNIGAYAVNVQSFYKNKYEIEVDEYKNSIYAYKNGLALPLHCGLEIKDVEYVVNCLRSILNE